MLRRGALMSDASTDLNFVEQAARIDNLRQEALTFMAIQHVLAAEQSWLATDAGKLRGDQWWAPLL
jgi:hypothetical protein